LRGERQIAVGGLIDVAIQVKKRRRPSLFYNAYLFLPGLPRFMFPAKAMKHAARNDEKLYKRYKKTEG
jgi:hypothetical protein